MKNKLFGFLTGIFCLLFVGISAEIYVRTVVDDGMNYGLEMWKYAARVKTVSKIPSIGHEHQANASARLMGVDVSINRNKLRDNDIAFEREKNVLRILMLGDSLTFGWGVKIEETVSKRLERQLNETGIASEVINTGVGNYNTSMEVAYFLNEGHKYKPDIVVLNYFINDAEPTPTYSNGWLARHSFAYVNLSARWDILLRQLAVRPGWLKYYSKLYDENSPGRMATVKSIDALVDYSRENGIKLIFVNYPELRNLNDYPFSDVQNFVAAAAKKAKAPYVSLLETVKGLDEAKLWVSPDDSHPNGYANQLFVAPILAAVKDVLANDPAR